MTKTISRLFDEYSDATAAMRDLEGLGISHSDISVIANNAHGKHAGHPEGVDDHGDVTRGASTGAVLGGAGGLLAGLGLLAIPGLGPIVAAGWLAATAVGAGIGAAGGAATGTIVGALKNAGHSDEEANFYSEGVRRGGTLVSVKVPDEKIAEAEATLDRHSAVDTGARAEAYRSGGWTQFDETAPAYSTEEIERERATYVRETTRL